MSSDTNIIISKIFIIPQRYVLGIMCCLGTTLTYAVRYAFPVTVIFLSVPANTTQIGDRTCPTDSIDKEYNITPINVGERYPWDKKEQRLIEIYFYWFYPITQVVGGVVADQYGGKHTVGIPIFLIMMINFITPTIITLSGGKSNVAIIIRAIMGLIEGFIFPSMYSILAQWVPKCERTFIAALFISGTSFGKAMANSLTKFIISETRVWSSAFYLYGLMQLVWFVTWNLICYSTPQTHPFISDKEKEYLKEKLDGHVFLGRKKIPVWSMVKSVPLWATIIVQFGQTWITFAMIDKLPVFVRMLHQLNEEVIIKMDIAPHLCLAPFCIMCGLFSDVILRKQYLTITTIRKVLTTVGSMGPSIFILSATLLECNRLVSLWMFCAGVVLESAYYASSYINPLDHAPNFAGILKGIVNTLTVIHEVTGPLIEDQITNKPYERSSNEWTLIFSVAFAIMTVTNLVYVLFANSEEQFWNRIELKREETPPANFDNSMLYSQNND